MLNPYHSLVFYFILFCFSFFPHFPWYINVLLLISQNSFMTKDVMLCKWNTIFHFHQFTNVLESPIYKRKQNRKSDYFYIGHRKYNAQNLGVPVGAQRLLYGEVGMIPHWTRETWYWKSICLDGEQGRWLWWLWIAGALTLGMKPASVTVVWGGSSPIYKIIVKVRITEGFPESS